MPAGALVELSGVRFAYGGRHAFSLRVGSLSLARKERVACIGPSGSGKTTLVALIAGIIAPDAGRVFFDGIELTALGEAARRQLRIARIGMVFQEFELLEYLTAMENILLPFRVGSGMRAGGEQRDRARALAEELGVAHVLGRKPARLSHGERQRIAICRALATEPRLLMCDEPTGNLDPDSAARTLDLLLEQAERRDATVLMVTHDHSVLDRFDRVIDMLAFAAVAAPGAEA